MFRMMVASTSLADGKIVLSTGVEAAALAEFEDLKEQRNAERDSS